MDRLLLSVGFFLQALSVIWIIFLIRNRRAKKRFKEESLNLDERVVERVMSVLETEELYGISAITGTTYRGWREYDNRNNPMPLRERYGGILEEKEDFLPKKKMKYHTLEEPIEEYGGAPFSNNCYDTTIYDSL